VSKLDFAARYSAEKLNHPDAVLALRCGDFYEVMFADAKPVADILEITLTSRNGAPMCGFPVHSSARYVEILEAAGRRVALV
jgi:DNA mismatch repair protein MutS